MRTLNSIKQNRILETWSVKADTSLSALGLYL